MKIGKLKKLSMVMVLLLSLTACQNNESDKKDSSGVITGGVPVDKLANDKTFNDDKSNETKDEKDDVISTVTDDVPNKGEITYQKKEEIQKTETEITVNPLDLVPNGKTITLYKKGFHHPDNFNFGEWHDAALQLYNQYVQGNIEETIYLDHVFKSGEDWNKFLDYFENTVISDYNVRANINGYTSNDDGTVYRCNVEFSSLKDKMDEADTLYNALVSSGLYTGMNEKEAVIRINNYICNRATYVLIPAERENEILYSGQGKCWHYGKLFQNMCQEVGIQCDYVAGYNRDGVSAGHGWNRVFLNGSWYLVDVTWNDSSVSNQYLLLTDFPVHNQKYKDYEYYK